MLSHVFKEPLTAASFHPAAPDMRGYTHHGLEAHAT
jgi:hypothetical protein